MNGINQETVIIIPIRMASTRLPGKFHAQIGPKPMILHVIDRARESGIANIVVACDHIDHFKLIDAYGCKAVMTDTKHQSGSDRSFEALNIIDPEQKIKYVINLQGDMPFFNPDNIKQVANILSANRDCDIATLAALIDDQDDILNPNVVKVVFDYNNYALYFSRHAIPYTSNISLGNYFYHVGLYGYTRKALDKFVNLEQSSYELTEKLEQLRALQNGMKIKVGICAQVPISVDVPEDLVFANDFLAKNPIYA